jgi:uncharacterized protein YjiK
MKSGFFLIPILILALIMISCQSKSNKSEKLLNYIGGKTISVPEPSGLDLTYDHKGFWTVSDETSTIYKLDSEGNVVNTIKVDGFDMEGITTVNDSIIAVVLERTREVLLLDTSGNEIKRKDLGLRGEANSGLEGITYIPGNGHFYVLNEKKPSLLIELNSQLEIIRIDTLKFSRDVSGIFYDKKNKCLWILSDENQLIVKADMHGKPIDKINISVVQPEGITIDPAGKRLYVVSDNKNALYVYKFNQK